MKLKLLSLGLTVALLGAGVASAHHSGAMFDRSKEMVLTGTVKEFQWTNPHSWIQITVNNPGAPPIEWSVESPSPSNLARQGWTRNTFKAGDSIALTINPLRSGEHGGNFVSAKFSDGHMVNRNGVGGPDGAPPQPQN